MAVDISMQSISLPTNVSNDILQKTQEDSAVMRLARQITLPGRGVTIPVITGDPAAAWVNETADFGIKQQQVRNRKVSHLLRWKKEFRGVSSGSGNTANPTL